MKRGDGIEKDLLEIVHLLSHPYQRFDAFYPQPMNKGARLLVGTQQTAGGR